MRFSSSQIQSLFVGGDDDSDSDAWCPGDRAETSTFQRCEQGQETDTLGPPPTQFAHGDTTGIASHVGQLEFTYDLTVNLSNGSGTGSGHLFAANGDRIDTTIVGQFELTSPGVGSITEVNTIMGGTGRFAGAQGSFTVERLINLGTGLTSGSFHGYITSPDAAD